MQIKIDADGYVIGYADEGFEMDGATPYNGAIPEGFNGETCRHYRLVDDTLMLDEDAQAAGEATRKAQEELAALYEWFAWYDVQVMQYGRCQRLGVEFDQDMAVLDAEAVIKQERIREIREGLWITE
jgi:hypothetical protein